MPSLTFVLPHWIYWSGLVLFPLAAMVLARRSRKRGGMRAYSLPLGYMILVTGGMLGLHRFYLKSLLGLVYLPIFLAILFANAQQRDARAIYSDAANMVRVSQDTISREGPRIAEAEKELEDLKAAVLAAEEGSLSRRSAELKVKRSQRRLQSARDRLDRAHTDLKANEPLARETGEARAYWGSVAYYAFLCIAALLLIDAALLPRLKRRAEERVRSEREAEAEVAIHAYEEEEIIGDFRHASTGWTGAIDRLSLYCGEFASYWAVIAVFVYYYEVIARYVFNSPTNWAHEGMFLMFGMQYLIAGAYAMLTESHVRVDVFYAPLSARRKAVVDLLTSVFFFIFAGTLLATSWIFAYQATQVGEISFTEWAIAYWPFKWAMVLGGLLLVLQGISKLAQDLRAVANPAGGI
ncbi:TRAP transporter small permease subunit [Breoghania sp.]|uniref:TRAP transporter small permease subunit n=1 Tax=Breoghania sp. TaxID=2065378 RepID=UPI002AA7CBF7|nr:TRAP transporter small permease subunit [Breoghania sp.]